jgi:hypothetical protein
MNLVRAPLGAAIELTQEKWKSAKIRISLI